MNLVLICLDTFRADIIGEGKKFSFVKTPNLDTFARESVEFTHAFGEGQPTLQIRRAFMTGRRSFPWRYNFDRRGHFHHAAGWHKIPPEQDTMAEILSRRGYMCGLVADVYHMFKPTMNYSRGFTNYDFIRGQESDNWRGGTPAHVEHLLKRHVREPINWPKHSGLMQYLLNQRFRQGEEDYSCARVFRSAAQWLEDNATNAPFMLWVEAFDPHEPWDPPKEYADMYCPDYTGKDFIAPGAAYEGGPPSQREIDRVRALYYGECSLVDRWVGHLLAKIGELKLWDDTLVVVLSDHGTQVMDHGGFGKGPKELHPFNTQIVWHMRHPDGPRGTKVDGFVQSHDMMPTVLGLLGYPYETDGVDVWPLATGAKSSVRDHVVIGWADWAQGTARGRASIRDGQWNYVVGVGYEDEQPELYHVTEDPDEENNVIELHPHVVSMQRKRLEAVLGQAPEAPQNEVCDRQAPPPFALYWAQNAPPKAGE